MVLASTIREIIPVEWTEEDTSSINSAITVDHAAEGGFAHLVTWITVTHSAAPSASAFELIEDPSGTPIVRFHQYSPANGQTNPDPLLIQFRHPIRISPGMAVRLSIGASGSGVISKIAMGGYTVPQGLRI